MDKPIISSLCFRGLALSESKGFTLISKAWLCKSKACKGFTLIELLIVIAVLGVLAAGVLVAINPAEQLARARDASRKTVVGQLSKAMQAHYTSQIAYVSSANQTTWVTALKNAGEIKSVPGAIAYSSGSACATNPERGFCYFPHYPFPPTDTVEEVTVYTRLESRSESAKCPDNFSTYFLWSSKAGKTGIVCADSEIEGLRPDINIVFQP